MFKLIGFLIFISILTTGNQLFAQSYPPILTLKQEAEWLDSVLEKRLDVLIPALMEREKIDMWVISAREYNEDPVIRTMLPATWFAARRRTILVFHNNGKSVERLAVARYDIGRFFKKSWNPEQEPDQIKRLAELIKEKAPQKIAFNFSNTFGHADGITFSEMELINKSLDLTTQKKIVSGENLAVGWMELRIPEEVEMMKTLTKIGHQIIKNGFSSAVIQPGKTTTEDMQWWFREEIRRLGLQTWFHTSVDLQRAETAEHEGDFSKKQASDVIQKGDLLHIDIGVKFARLNTDQQQHAYILKDGETDAPQGLKDALVIGNRLQDHLTSSFEIGKSGNQILKIAREKAIKDGIKPSIYTHPLGFYGHAAGPTIGMWDNQGDTKGAGDYPLFAQTGYSIELNASVFIPEWNKEVKIMLEENAFFDGKTVEYYNGRQTELILVK